MTLEDFKKLIKTLKIPSAYGVFKKQQTTPYILYYRDSSASVNADDSTYYSAKHIILELYSKDKDITSETAIEKLLTDNDIPYEVDEDYISDEKLRRITYYFYI